MAKHRIVGRLTSQAALPEGGRLSCDRAQLVQIGDRAVPDVMTYHHPGDAGAAAYEARVELRNGVPTCTWLTFSTSAAGAPVRPKDVRAVGVELERSIGYWVTMIAQVRDEAGGWQMRPFDREAFEAMADAVARTGRRIHHRVDDELLAQVAEIVNTTDNSEKHAAVATALGVSPRTGQRFIAKARAAGHLPPSAPRRSPK